MSRDPQNAQNEDHIEIAETEPDRSLSMGWLLSGESFFQAARHLREATDNRELRLRFDMPMYYLYSHAIELILKAFLRSKGITAERLRQKPFGHRIKALWEKSISEGLPDHLAQDAFVSEIIRLLDKSAVSFEFRYLQVGFKSLPNSYDVERAVAYLKAGIEPHCQPT